MQLIYVSSRDVAIDFPLHLILFVYNFVTNYNARLIEQFDYFCLLQILLKKNSAAVLFMDESTNA